MLPANAEVARETLLSLQVTTRSLLGAITWHAGGIRIDHGWIRLLGSPQEPAFSLSAWNASLGGSPLEPPLDEALIVGFDAVGGLFAINGGAWSTAPGTMHYFAPDRQAWESMDVGHGEFVSWTLAGDLSTFYAGARWSGWMSEVDSLDPMQVISIYPPLGFQGRGGEVIPLEDRDRRPVPAREQWMFMNAVGSQLGDTGGAVRFVVKD